MGPGQMSRRPATWEGLQCGTGWEPLSADAGKSLLVPMAPCVRTHLKPRMDALTSFRMWSFGFRQSCHESVAKEKQAFLLYLVSSCHGEMGSPLLPSMPYWQWKPNSSPSGEFRVWCQVMQYMYPDFGSLVI